MKIIEIDIWSSFGCFSKHFSNTGGVLTHLIPPKTSIIGIIGAILGYEVNEYVDNDDGTKTYKIESLNNIKVSIYPLFEFKTKRVIFNLVSGTNLDLDIKNINQDVLISPKYKLFISFPSELEKVEECFLNRIKNNQTIFNLYMGRNEFPLNLKFVREINAEKHVFSTDNSDELKSIKVYGSLNRSSIKSLNLYYENNDSKVESNALSLISSLLISNSDDGVRHLKSFHEFTIKDYPIKRENFTDFSYSPISFYSSKKFGECFFSNLILKDGEIELVNIGDDRWLSLI